VTNAPLDINIPGVLRTELSASIAKALASTEPPSAQLFDVAAEEIYRLMSSDSYYRFATLVESGTILFDFSTVKATTTEEKEISTPERASQSRTTEKNPLLTRDSSVGPSVGTATPKLSFAEPEVQLDLSPLVEAPEKSENDQDRNRNEHQNEYQKEKSPENTIPSPSMDHSTAESTMDDIEVEMSVL